MGNIARAKNVQRNVIGVLNRNASDLTRVPEIENDRPEDTIHKLQIQIFELADALADLAQEVEETNRVIGR